MRNLDLCFPAFDRRVNGISVILQKSLKEYNDLAHEIKPNPFQRKPIRRGDRTIRFLREDIRQLCLMPPIVLSTTEEFSARNSATTDALLLQDSLTTPDVEDLVKRAIDSREILILDGLQRTYAIEEVLASPDFSKALESHPIRLELYLGLNRAGILYRMLTLNTGQTKMSIRHQLEIVYKDHLEKLVHPSGLRIVLDVDRARTTSIHDYRFSNVIELYIACIHGNPAPLGKETVFDRISSIDFLEKYGTKVDEMMMELLELYHKLAVKTDAIAGGWKLQEKERLARTFGTTIAEIFGKPQMMTGFGSAIHDMSLEEGGLEAAAAAVDAFETSRTNLVQGILALLENLNEVTERGYRSKIGPLQRRYFDAFFRHFLSRKSSSYLDIGRSAQEAYRALRVESF